MKGQVDHFVPVAVLKASSRDSEAYEWNNFRYGDGTINGRKWKHLVLDPFEVKPEWYTIKQLGLRDDEVVLRYRREWFSLYQRENLDIDGLREVAPLIADAVVLDLNAGKDWRQNGGAT
jgi:hypothetical protein